MKLGMNLFLWTGHVNQQHFPLFGALAQTGFDLIELPRSDYTPAETQQINAELDALGLSRTVATILDEHCNPISPDPRIRQAALEKLRADIDLTAALGAEALIGPIHSAHKQFSGCGPGADEFSYCVDILRAAGEYAATLGIELSVEFLNRFECYFLNTCQQASELTRAIGLDNVGVLYDTHHAQIEEGNQGAAIKNNARDINQIHISESHRGTPGTGTVDWVSVFEGLNSSAYNGRLVIEAFGTQDPSIASAVNIWRNCFESEEAVYRDGYRLIAGGIREESK
tara:strand:+ start:605 stop:1456 length:852 start_codon:yes stop_codon:yes gene_type:complete